jgi:hypothetical protein
LADAVPLSETLREELVADEASSFAMELQTLTEEMVTGEIGNLRYRIRSENDGKWTIRDAAADDEVIGDPHQGKGAAITEALRLNAEGEP